MTTFFSKSSKHVSTHWEQSQTFTVADKTLRPPAPLRPHSSTCHLTLLQYTGCLAFPSTCQGDPCFGPVTSPATFLGPSPHSGLEDYHKPHLAPESLRKIQNWSPTCQQGSIRLCPLARIFTTVGVVVYTAAQKLVSPQGSPPWYKDERSTTVGDLWVYPDLKALCFKGTNIFYNSVDTFSMCRRTSPVISAPQSQKSHDIASYQTRSSWPTAVIYTISYVA